MLLFACLLTHVAHVVQYILQLMIEQNQSEAERRERDLRMLCMLAAATGVQTPGEAMSSGAHLRSPSTRRGSSVARQDRLGSATNPVPIIDLVSDSGSEIDINPNARASA
jgi:hypothetical protein